MTRVSVCLTLTLLLVGASVRVSAQAGSTVKAATVEGVRLQYLDWGGPGDGLVFVGGQCDAGFVSRNG